MMEQDDGNGVFWALSSNAGIEYKVSILGGLHGDEDGSHEVKRLEKGYENVYWLC